MMMSESDDSSVRPARERQSSACVGGRGDGGVSGGEGGGLHVLQVAGQGGDVHGRLLRPATAQDLNRVEHLLRLELGELEGNKSGNSGMDSYR